MARGIKIANPGINALTDTNPKNFSLFVDGSTDHILIKEHSRGTVSLGSFASTNINHNLGYIPNVMVAVQIGSDYELVYGLAFYETYNAYVSTTNLFMQNRDSVTRTFSYYIFYDEL